MENKITNKLVEKQLSYPSLIAVFFINLAISPKMIAISPKKVLKVSNVVK